MIAEIQFDKQKTQERFQKLQDYSRIAQIEPGTFHCKYLETCKRSLPEDLALEPENCGGLAHVGEGYDVSLDGQKLRILFVGYDYGGGNSSLEERRKVIQTYERRQPNWHYKGIVKTLIEIFQERYEADGHWRNLLKRMAQTNATRCCAPKKTPMKKNTTYLMTLKCWEHFRKEIEVLEPTLILFQGKALRASFEECLRGEGLIPRQPFADFEECLLVNWTIFLNQFTCILAFFSHPAHSHYGREWEPRVVPLIQCLRQHGYVPTFQADWKPIARGEWPKI